MTLPGGDEVCYGYHVWGGRYGDECRRCGLVDLALARQPERRAAARELRDVGPEIEGD